MADPETRITELEIRLGFLEAEVGPLLRGAAGRGAQGDRPRAAPRAPRAAPRSRPLRSLAPPQEG
ncbi:MAG: hypothetical protein RML12_07695 [Xanthomonadales bacterium]|nr:hypothetical protein [Xanthomonadales bacterium]